MPKLKGGETGVEKCPGGVSFNRKRHEHEKGKIPDIVCYRCNNRMGCSRCCDPANDLICLVCHNWATKIALARHGDIVPNAKVPVVRTDTGIRRWTHGNEYEQLDMIIKRATEVILRK